MLKLLLTAALTLAALCSGLAQGTNILAEAPKEAQTNKSSMKEIVAKAYESFGTTATNAVDWVKKDFERAGTWRYKIATFPIDPGLESKLNDIGKEGWECFWVRETKDGLTFFFKKAEKGVIAEALKHRP